VFPDQFIDRTKHREATFFGEGIVGHVQFGEPTTPRLRALGVEAARAAMASRPSGAEGATVHEGGTCVVMEGPAFSTRAESELYRSWGARVIGMTALPEAKLAREAEIAYAMMALSTDYDCWHVEEVTVEAVMKVVAANVALAQRTILELAARLPASTEELPYPRACEGVVMTAPHAMPEATRARLDLIIGHYLSDSK
jgi:5'-methylthioadenosine phosphorylase